MGGWNHARRSVLVVEIGQCDDGGGDKAVPGLSRRIVVGVQRLCAETRLRRPIVDPQEPMLGADEVVDGIAKPGSSVDGRSRYRPIMHIRQAHRTTRLQRSGLASCSESCLSLFKYRYNGRCVKDALEYNVAVAVERLELQALNRPRRLARGTLIA